MATRCRLYPGTMQEAAMCDHCAHARYVWNLCVEQESWWRPGRGRTPRWSERCRQLAEARAVEPWLAGGSSAVQQQAIRDFERAMQAFFDPKNPAGKPGYRSKRGTQGFVIRDTKVRRLSRRWGVMLIPKCGWVRFRWTRPLPGELGMARVTLDGSGRWHVSFPGIQPVLDRQPTGAVVGVDRGVRTALVTSDGQHYRAPRISHRRAARYLALQRRMNRQQKGSRKREKTRLAVARITARVADRRKDWAEKISTHLVQDYDLIAFEKLQIRNMVGKPRPKPDPGMQNSYLPNGGHRKAGLNRAILTSGWGLLARRAEEKAAASGAMVVYVDPRFTSQQCHACGHIAPENRESQAVFRCQHCGHLDHADANAACNILARGLAQIASSRACPGARGARPHKTPAVAGAAGTARSAA